ncbi:MAG TPA: Crp/Fnr family transcriptional regulator [Flavihumibacter sp.]|nr:Crp/Fnr family transcriptional regulator [Bacteroidota bacterium]HQD09666.1 Crp/Fnr family transcriptional regulator [Flavihumibacter sp.]
MHIDYDILVTYGGIVRKYDKGAILFREGDTPCYFYQLVEGKVKMFSTNSEGKDLIQGNFTAGESFGEPPLIINKDYPSTAQTCSEAIIIRISKERLLSILHDYPDLQLKMLYAFAERIYSKANAAQILLCKSAEEKIVNYLHLLKGGKQREPILINKTRQEIAESTGLRVETVIRTLLKMEAEQKVKIIDHKIYY